MIYVIVFTINERFESFYLCLPIKENSENALNGFSTFCSEFVFFSYVQLDDRKCQSITMTQNCDITSHTM